MSGINPAFNTLIMLDSYCNQLVGTTYGSGSIRLQPLQVFQTIPAGSSWTCCLPYIYYLGYDPLAGVPPSGGANLL